MAVKNMSAWRPSKDRKAQSQLYKFMTVANKKNYQALYNWSINFPEQFWPALCEFCDIKFSHPYEKVLSQHKTMFGTQWFAGAQLNFAQRLLSQRDNKTAIIAYTENSHKELNYTVLTYRLLYQKVSLLAQIFKQHGVGINDRVAGYLSNNAEAIIAMLAASSLGAVWTACSPDFGIHAVTERLQQISPKILIAQSHYSYQGKHFDNAEKITFISRALPSIEKLFIFEKNLDNIFEDYKSSISAELEIDYIQLPFDHPVYILYSSGTTGLPKCIVHGAGGTLCQHLKELKLHTDITERDIVFYYTTPSWMMWHWFVSSLSLGATLILYDGSPFYPDPEFLLRLIQREKISIFGASAKYFSALEKHGVQAGQYYNLNSLRTILSTGSPLLSSQFDYIYNFIKSDICIASISGGTDIISCFALGNPLLPVYKGELQCLGLGMKVEVFDAKGKSVINQKGELVCTQAFPSMPVYFWNDPDQRKYYTAYFEKFPGIWTHGDYAKLVRHNDDHSGLIIYGRSDAVLNPGGIRIGTAEIYREVEQIIDIIESIAAGKEENSDIKIILFVKLRESILLTDDLKKQITERIRKNLSPHHVPFRIIQVPDIPRTINGKIVELAVREVINGREVKNLDSIINPETLTYFKL